MSLHSKIIQSQWENGVIGHIGTVTRKSNPFPPIKRLPKIDRTQEQIQFQRNRIANFSAEKVNKLKADWQKRQKIETKQEYIERAYKNFLIYNPKGIGINGLKIQSIEQFSKYWSNVINKFFGPK